MSRGRHTRPRARGGGLATLLALAVAGGAVAVAVVHPSPSVMRWCYVGLSAAAALGLIVLARFQRRSSRALARTEDRLRVLEQRNRDEGGELHRRVIESIAREGELRYAVDVLSMEIARLRSSLEGFVAPVEAAVSLAAAAAERPEPRPAAPEQAPDTLDLPLVQRVLAAQESAGPAAPVPAAPVQEATPTAAAPANQAAPETPVRSWVVREIELEEEPSVALTMRILDLTAPPASPSREAGSEADESATWASFARPA